MKKNYLNNIYWYTFFSHGYYKTLSLGNDNITIEYYNINSLENTNPYSNLEFKCLKRLNHL